MATEEKTAKETQTPSTPAPTENTAPAGQRRYLAYSDIVEERATIPLETVNGIPVLVERIEFKPGKFGKMAVMDIRRPGDGHDGWAEKEDVVIQGGVVAVDQLTRLDETMAKRRLRYPVVVTMTLKTEPGKNDTWIVS